jgi:hypothetical protein
MLNINTSSSVFKIVFWDACAAHRGGDWVGSKASQDMVVKKCYPSRNWLLVIQSIGSHFID